MPIYIFFNSHVVAREATCSSSSSAQTGGCVAYEHADFDGMRQDLGANRVFNFVGDDMNDKISSFRVSANCRVIAWENINRGGASTVFGGDCSYIGDNWNDVISSWECKCETPKPFGPDTCLQGYVWREATRDDHVCVTPETRAQTWSDNKTNPNETCPRGLVWREATPQDHICVDPSTRARAWDDNSHASERIAR